jgi:hypothetical protein
MDLTCSIVHYPLVNCAEAIVGKPVLLLLTIHAAPPPVGKCPQKNGTRIKMDAKDP